MIPNCDNCDEPVNDLKDALSVKLGSDLTLATICKHCQEKVLTLKIVLSRETGKDEFRYEQILPVATEKT